MIAITVNVTSQNQNSSGPSTAVPGDIVREVPRVEGSDVRPSEDEWSEAEEVSEEYGTRILSD